MMSLGNTSPNPYAEEFIRHGPHSRVTGLPVNPECLFVYWYVNEERRHLICDHFMMSWDTLPLCLCAYDVTDLWFDGYNAPLAQRVNVHPEADNWYFHQLSPGRNYIVDLAAFINDEKLFCILRSNLISLPQRESTGTGLRARFLAPDIHLEVTPQASPLERYQHVFDGYHPVN